MIWFLGAVVFTVVVDFVLDMGEKVDDLSL